MRVRDSSPEHLERARSLRKSASLPERLLWNAFRAMDLPFRIRRQYPVGRYTLDFYIPTCKLGIEIDGQFHDQIAKVDEVRDRYLEFNFGIETRRVAAASVLENPAGVAECLAILASERLGVTPPAR